MIKDNQHGRSMIEVIGYMGAVMAIVAGVGKMVSGAYNDYKISKASQQLSDLAGAIVRASTVYNGYKETVTAIKNGTDEGRKLIPSSFRVVGDQIFHAFGGAVTLGTEGDKFYIRFDNLTREQCIEMGMKDWINNKVVDLNKFIVNGTEEGKEFLWPSDITDKDEQATLPAKRSDLAGANDDDNGVCDSKEGGKEQNNITWVFN